MSLLRSAVCICMYGCNTVLKWFSRLILRSCGIPGTGGRSSAAQRGAQQEKERGRGRGRWISLSGSHCLELQIPPHFSGPLLGKQDKLTKGLG